MKSTISLRSALVGGIACLSALASMGGCSGRYFLTVPDQIAPAGGQTFTVVRLQKNDFFVLAPPIRGAAIRFRFHGGHDRGAYTDDLGYAGTTVPVPKQPGKYTLLISHMDREGQEVSTTAATYVWPPDTKVVAVDLDCLPGRSSRQASGASDALAAIARAAHIVYLTRKKIADHARLHCWMTQNGYPDGPILLWQREYWHIVRGHSMFSVPRLVVESRLVSQLGQLRKEFPGLTVGVCDSTLASQAFVAAHLRCVVVGRADVSDVRVTRRASWRELAANGI